MVHGLTGPNYFDRNPARVEPDPAGHPTGLERHRQTTRRSRTQPMHAFDRATDRRPLFGRIDHAIRGMMAG